MLRSKFIHSFRSLCVLLKGLHVACFGNQSENQRLNNLFNQLDNSLKHLEMNERMRFFIYRRLGAIVHLNMIEFQDIDSVTISVLSKKYLENGARLLEVDHIGLLEALTTNKISVSIREELIK